MAFSSAIRRRATSIMALTTAVTAMILVAGPASANAAPAHAVGGARHPLAGTIRPGKSAVHRDFTWKVRIPIRHPGQAPNAVPAFFYTTCQLMVELEEFGAIVDAFGQYTCGAQIYYMAIDVALLAADDGTVFAENGAEGYDISSVAQDTGWEWVWCGVPYLAAAQAATRFDPNDPGEGTGWLWSNPLTIC